MDVDFHNFSWFSKPKIFHLSSDQLTVEMDPKTDFWQKTYYTPLLVADNGHFLHTQCREDKMMMQVTFDLEAKQQFDQAGLMFRVDSDHWIKAGLEYVDGSYRLSCVVTNLKSDWSTQAYPSGKLSLRLYKLGCDVVMEYKIPAAERWDFVRICHLSGAKVDGNSCVMAGPFACAPTDVGGKVTFTDFILKPVDGFHHSN